MFIFVIPLYNNIVRYTVHTGFPGLTFMLDFPLYRKKSPENRHIFFWNLYSVFTEVFTGINDIKFAYTYQLFDTN